MRKYYLMPQGIKRAVNKSITKYGSVGEGRFIFKATEESVYAIAFKRAELYHKYSSGKATRFYVHSIDLPTRLICFDCYGSFYLDTVKPFFNKCVGLTKYVLYKIGLYKIKGED